MSLLHAEWSITFLGLAAAVSCILNPHTFYMRGNIAVGAIIKKSPKKSYIALSLLKKGKN